MASCQDVHDVIQTRPNATEMRVASIVDFPVTKTALNTFTTTALLATKEINLVNDDFATNVLTYQACLALGIHYTYTNPMVGIDQAHRKRREAIIQRKCDWRKDNVLAECRQDEDKGEKRPVWLYGRAPSVRENECSQPLQQYCAAVLVNFFIDPS